MTGLRRFAKRALGAGEVRPHRVMTGAFKGLVLHLDAAHATQVVVGLCERETYAWLERLTRNIGSAVDVGADRGEMAIYLLRRTSAKRVLAFEPNPENAAVFERNLMANGLAGNGDLRVVAKFLGDREDAEWTTLDACAGELPEPVFVKIDVDGGEADVLRGAGKLLRSARSRFLIETHSLELERLCARMLADYRFDTKVIRNAWWRRIVPEHRPIAHNRWLVAFRADDEFTSRC